MTPTTIDTRIAVHGFHAWPGAEAVGVSLYLARRHRHLFIITVTCAVTHDDRDVEFHELQRATHGILAGVYTRLGVEYDFGASSCESIARTVAYGLVGGRGFAVRAVHVSEDGECGATVTVDGGGPPAPPEPLLLPDYPHVDVVERPDHADGPRQEPGTVWLLPIEPFEERYTAQWYKWWPEHLRAAGLTVRVIDGASVPYEQRSGGEWLDPALTWAWKGSQVAALAQAWSQVQDGDVVLTLDLWGPATTAALYMRHTTRRKVAVVGWYHAGASDPHDFLARSGMRSWALDVERGWLRGVDAVLCGSAFAARMAAANTGLTSGELRAYVVGYPIVRHELLGRVVEWRDRPARVVFPHRLAPEKRHDLFVVIRSTFERKYGAGVVEWVTAREVCKTKLDYYNLLGSSRAVVSTATQETFGIAQQEGVALGAYSVAPRHLCYPEVHRPGTGLLYTSVEEAAEFVFAALNAGEAAPWDNHHGAAVARAAHALRLALGDPTAPYRRS